LGIKDPDENMPRPISFTLPDLPIGPGGPVKVVKHLANPKRLMVIGEKMETSVIPYAKKNRC
jgi:hypothetical protein